MKRLSKEIYKNKIEYKQVCRGEKAFVYHAPEFGNYYEVFERKISPAATVFGKDIPEREVFPGNEDFGKWAWAIRGYGIAMKRYREIENCRDVKVN